MRLVLPSRAAVARGLPTLLAAAFGAGVLVGFLGTVHPALDTAAHFRAHAAVALALACLVLLAQRRFAAGLGGLTVAAFALWSVLPFLLPAGPPRAALPGQPRYTLLQMNLRFDAPDPVAALRLIGERRPDVVTAQEMTPDWADAFERLRDTYPYQFFCEKPFWHGDAAILSRRPFLDADKNGVSVCDGRNAFAARTIDFNGLPLTVAAQHLRWPWPGRQPRMLAALAPTLASLRGPLLVAGDFNAAPWSAAVGAYAKLSGTRILAGIGPSWISSLLPPSLARFVGLPIDNVLVSDGVEVLGVETLAPTTSDHLPVLVTFTLRFALPEEPEVQSAAMR